MSHLQHWEEAVLGTFLNMAKKSAGRAEILARVTVALTQETPSDMEPIDGTYTSHQQDRGGEA